MDRVEKCPCCLSPDMKFAFEGHTTLRPQDPQIWTVFKCQNCGLGFLNPMPNWQELQEYYDEGYEAYIPKHTVVDDGMVEKALQEGMLRYLPSVKDKKVLDLGCGAGLFLQVSAKLGAQTWGVEPSPIAAEVSRSAGINVFNGKLEDFETAERFDVITANQVLEHVPEPVDTLTRMRGLLAPGGSIWITVPNAACVWAERLTWKWDGADLPYHLLQFTPESLHAAGRRAGLEPRRTVTESLPGIVKYSMQKHLRENYLIPKRLSRLFLSDEWAARTGREMDAKVQGDNLIVEFQAA